MTDNKYINIDPDYSGLIADYIKEAADQIHKLEALLLEGKHKIDYLQIKRIAHNIKGSAGSYGIQILSDIFQQFEDNIKSLEQNKIGKINDYNIDILLTHIDFSNLIFERITDENYDVSDIVSKYSEKNLKVIIKDLDGEAANTPQCSIFKTVNSDSQNLIKPQDSNCSAPPVDAGDNTTGKKNTVPAQSVKLRILFILKSVIIKQMIMSHLENKKLAVEFIDKIELSLEHIRRFKPDIVRVNYIEECFSGAGLCALIKLSFIPRNIITVLLSSEDDASILGKEYCDYIVKKDEKMYSKIISIIENPADGKKLK